MAEVKLEDLTEEKLKQLRDYLIPNVQAREINPNVMAVAVTNGYEEYIDYAEKAMEWYINNHDKVHEVFRTVDSGDIEDEITVDGTRYVSKSCHIRLKNELWELRRSLCSIRERCTERAKERLDERDYSGICVVTKEKYERMSKEKSQEKPVFNIIDREKLHSEFTDFLHGQKTTIEKISKDIIRQKNNAVAMAFTEQIWNLLRENGVTPQIAECEHKKEKKNCVEMNYGVSFCGLDFSEHDKKFEEEIDRLKAENAELHCELQAMNVFSDELPNEPIEVAQMLIHSTRECDHSTLSKLRQIAEHLLVYCNNNKEE